MDSRKDKLFNMFRNVDGEIDDIVLQVLEDICFIEEKLNEFKSYPFIEVSKRNPCNQRQTAAAKMYKDFLQQYSVLIKIMISYNKLGGKVKDNDMLTNYLNDRKKSLERYL